MHLLLEFKPTTVQPLQMTDFTRRLLPVIVTSINIGDGSVNQFLGIQVIETHQVDGVTFAAEIRNVSQPNAASYKIIIA
jgi:hypothetical protein